MAYQYLFLALRAPQMPNRVYTCLVGSYQFPRQVAYHSCRDCMPLMLLLLTRWQHVVTGSG